mgnify:CR=1 FL=1
MKATQNHMTDPEPTSHTHTATIADLTRDPTRRLVTLTLTADPARAGSQFSTATLTYRQAAQLGFWLKPGQHIELA